jgi:hypothetical protein
MNNIKDKYFGIFLIITIIYNSGSAFITINSILGAIFIFIGIILFFLYRPMKINIFKVSYLNIYFMISIFIIFISMLVNLNFIYILTNLKYLALLLFSFYFIKIIDYKIFINYYIKIMLFLVAVSLVPFVLINFFNLDFLSYMPIAVNTNGVIYHIGILFNYYDYNQSRNMSLFWEPSIFSSFIIMALIYEIIYNKKSSILRIILFTLGLLSTGSSGGFLLMPLVILLFVIKNKGILYSLFIQSTALLIVIYLYYNISELLMFLVNLNPMVFSKFTREESSSVSERSDSPIINIDLFINNPIFGNGLGKVDELYSSFMIAQTSTSTYFLAVFGIFGIFYTISILYGAYRQKQLNIIARVLLFTILLVIVNKESHANFVLTHIMIFYLLNNDTKKYIL